MNEQGETLPCLYCGGFGPRTDEHVMWSAFDGALVLSEDVCGDCNTRVFSPVDTSFVRYIRRWVVHDHPDARDRRSPVEGMGIAFVPEHRVWVNVFHDRQARQTPMPQLVHCSDGWQYIVGERGPTLETLASELAAPSKLRLETAVYVDADPPVEQAIVRTAKLMYLARAATETEAIELLRQVQRGDFAHLSLVGQSREGTARLEVEIPVAFPLGDMQRAVAKFTVNAVCAIFGSDTARGAQLAPLRRLALKGGSFLDAQRHVTLLTLGTVESGIIDAIRNLAEPGHHSAVFLPGPDGACQMFLLLYQRPIAVVRTFLPPFDVCAMLFDYRSRTQRFLQWPLDHDWFFERVPALAEALAPFQNWSERRQ